jgi:outer membrane protein
MRKRVRRILTCLWLAAVAGLVAWASRPGWAQEVVPPPPTPPPVPELSAPPLPPDIQSPVPTDRPISLQEAIAVALREQPQMALADASVRAAAGRTRQSLPTVSVGSQYTQTGPARGGGTGAVGSTFTTGGYTTNFSGRQLLYDFGRTPAEIAQARAQQSSARQGLAQTRQDIVEQVKQSYYQLLQNEQLVDVQKRNLADQQAHLDLTQALLDAGKAPRSDVVKAQTSVASAVLQVTTAQTDEAIARVNLNVAMGVDARTPTTVEETEAAPPALPEPAALVEQALASRPAVAQSRANVNAAEQAARAAQRGNRPALYASANYGLSGATFPPGRESYSYGVSVQWSVFDAGLTRGRLEEARASLLSAQADLRQLEQQVTSEVTQAYLNVQSAEQMVTEAGAEVTNAVENVGLATGRYQAGVALYIEVTDAQTELLAARINEVNARYALSAARAALQRALGMEEQ